MPFFDGSLDGRPVRPKDENIFDKPPDAFMNKSMRLHTLKKKKM